MLYKSKLTTMCYQTCTLQFLLEPTQTERDYTTRRDYFVFKSKQNGMKFMQDMHTK